MTAVRIYFLISVKYLRSILRSFGSAMGVGMGVFAWKINMKMNVCNWPQPMVRIRSRSIGRYKLFSVFHNETQYVIRQSFLCIFPFMSLQIIHFKVNSQKLLQQYCNIRTAGMFQVNYMMEHIFDEWGRFSFGENDRFASMGLQYFLKL